VGRSRVALGGFVGSRLGPVLLSEGSHSPYAPMFALLGALFVGAIGYLTASTIWTTALQEEVAEEMRGRIMGLWTLAFLGTRPLAAIVDGSVADLAGPRVAVLVVLVPLLAVAWHGVRVIREVPAPRD
jgi:dipeptide/tripeptide permease